MLDFIRDIVKSGEVKIKIVSKENLVDVYLERTNFSFEDKERWS